MLHHYMTKYIADGKQYVTSWLQLSIFGLIRCFSIRKQEIEG